MRQPFNRCPPQMRNLHMALMLAQGTPMLLAGDEYASVSL